MHTHTHTHTLDVCVMLCFWTLDEGFCFKDGTVRTLIKILHSTSGMISVLSKGHGSACLHLVSQGSHLREKNAFFTQKKSRLCKSENAVRLPYAKKKSDLTHQNAFSLFVFCTQQRRFVEHLLWVWTSCDFPRPLPPPFSIASRWRDAGAYVTMFMTPIDTDHAHTPCVPQIKMQLDEVR